MTRTTCATGHGRAHWLGAHARLIGERGGVQGVEWRHPPVEPGGKSVGKHATEPRFTTRALLGPIRGGQPDWEPPPDLFGVSDKQPANTAIEVLPVPAGGALARPSELAPVPPSDKRPRGFRELIRLAELAALVLTGLALFGTAWTAGSSSDEANRVMRVVAAARPDVPRLAGPAAQRLFDALTAGWLSATSGLDRYDDPVAAVREPLIVAAILMVGTLWLVTWRLDLSAPTRLIVLLIVAVDPALRELLATGVHPGVLAAVFVFSAIAVVAGTSVTTISRVGALVCLAVAVLLLPALLPALLVTLGLMVLMRDLGIARPRWQRVPLGGLLALVGLASMAALLLRRERFTGIIGDLPTDPLGLEPIDAIMAGLVGLLLLATIIRTWLRAPAIGVLALLATALAAPATRPDLLVIAAPFAAVLAVATAEDLLHELRRVVRWRTRPRTVRLGLSAMTVAVSLLAVVVAAADLPRPAAPTAPRQVAAWFGSEVPDASPIAVDDRTWSALVVAGIPANRLRHTITVDTTWWVGAPAGVGPQWSTYATFGTGRATLRVMRLPTGDAGGSLADRMRLGAGLAANPRFVFSAAAAEKLRIGAIDLRLITVLTALSSMSRLTIIDFPTVQGELPGQPPLRRMTISEVNGRPAGSLDPAEPFVHWLNTQLPEYKPCAIEPSGAVLLVRYCVTPPLP